MAFLPISRNKKVDFAEDSYARGQISTNRNWTVWLCKILLNEKKPVDINCTWKWKPKNVYMGYKVMLVWSRTKAEYLPALSLLGRSCKPISLHRFITGRADTGIVRHFLLVSNFSSFKIKIKIIRICNKNME